MTMWIQAKEELTVERVVPPNVRFGVVSMDTAVVVKILLLVLMKCLSIPISHAEGVLLYGCSLWLSLSHSLVVVRLSFCPFVDWL